MLNAMQISVLRSQFSKLANDEAVVAFAETNRVIMEDDQIADLAEKAADAFDRLEAKKIKKATEQAKQAEKTETAVEKTEEEGIRERHEKIAKMFSSKGFGEAAVAIEMDIDGKDAKTLSEVVRTLDEAIRESGIYGWAKHYAVVHRKAAKKALDAMAETTATKLFIWFSAVLSRAMRALDSLKNARSDSFKEGLVRQARQHLVEADGIRFQGWALSALERLMNGKDNPISDLFVSDKDIAGTVFAAPDGRKAVALLDAMKNRVTKRLESVHVGPARPGKTERDRQNRKNRS